MIVNVDSGDQITISGQGWNPITVFGYGAVFVGSQIGSVQVRQEKDGIFITVHKYGQEKQEISISQE